METLGRFEVIRTLGQGAYGKVFLCRDPKGGSEVAIKVIRAELLGDTRTRLRFLREVEALDSLDHEGIVALREYIEPSPATRGRGLLVTDFVSGGSADAKLREGGMGLVAAVKVVAAAARAMHYAHGLGVVHRDLKPDNLLLTQSGEGKVADFGLSRKLSDEGLTEPGEGMGSMSYMPPEQLDNALNADARSDVYSLGATFYALLTGRPPFLEKTTRDFVLKILNGRFVDASQLVSSLRSDVDLVIRQAMTPNPERRYPSAEALALDLERLRRGEAIDPLPPPPKADVFADLMDFELEESPPLESPSQGEETSELDLSAAEDFVRAGEEGLAAGRFADAAACYSAALSLTPDDHDLRLRAGVALRRSGNPAAAQIAFSKVLAERADDPLALLGRAAARSDLLNFAGAVADYERILKLLPASNPKRERVRSALADARKRVGETQVRGQRLTELIESRGGWSTTSSDEA